MTQPYFLVDFNLDQPLQDFESLEGYSAIRGLVIWRGEALGEIELPIKGGLCTAVEQKEAIAQQFSEEILLRSLSESLVTGQWTPDLSWSDYLLQQRATTVSASHEPVSLTVVLCWAAAQGRVTAHQLASCLAQLKASLARLPQADVQLVVVGPRSCKTQVFDVAGELTLQYIADETNDLATQHRLAVDASESQLFGFLSPQVLVSSGWVSAIVQRFQEDADLMVMTGPLLPSRETSDVWEVLKRESLMMPSFDRRWYRQSTVPSERWQQVYFHHPIPEQNVVFRRSVLLQGLAEGDAIANAYRLSFAQMALGHCLCNDPALWARESLEQNLEQLSLSAQTEANRLGRYFAWGACASEGIPVGYKPIFFKESLGGLRWYGQSSLQKSGLAKQLFQAKLAGFSAALNAVWGKAGLASVLKQCFLGLAEAFPGRWVSEQRARSGQRMASRSLDLGNPLPFWDDLVEYDGVRIFVTHGAKLLGSIDLWHNRGKISPRQISEVLVRRLRDRLFVQARNGHNQAWQVLQLQLDHWLQLQLTHSLAETRVISLQLPLSVPVSVIITTCDRPEDLRNCLKHLQAQTSDRNFEIIVADNRPASGITPAVVKDFPGVRLVSEPRVGGSYGRNSAFCASTGEIVVTVDDDVTVPSDWLEKLLAPMVRPEVLVVTGNVLPRELEAEAQRMYENLYGGLGEGLEGFEANAQWLSSFSYAPPVWDLGVSANSAFRASVFHHPNIGMMPEDLGPGTPVGGGEENYLIYRILREGGTLVYEPSAYAWHRHRRTVPELRYQIYRQMMGGTAYHLRLWHVDQDMRSKQQLFSGLPRYFVSRIIEKFKGQHQVPWRFLWAEILGYLAGFWGYRQSLKAVKRQGYSEPYVPVGERSESFQLGKTSSLDDSQVSFQPRSRSF